MATNDNLFRRLRKLFAAGAIVRHVGGKRLKITDTDQVQQYLSNSYRDRYSRIFSGAGYGNTWNNQYGLNMAFQTQRIMLFREYDVMDADPYIAAALNVYADHCVLASEQGEILKIESDNHEIKEILHNLFYDIMNIEFNLWAWTRGMMKYGDYFLFLEISEKYGVVNVRPLSVYDTVRVEGEDIDNPSYVYFQTMGMNGVKTKMESYEVAHLRFLGDTNFLPYGRAGIEPARRVWKQLTMMVDAMLIHRIMRAPEKRVFKLDVGNIPPAEIDTYMEKLSEKMKKVPFQDPTTGDYNLRYNMMNILEDFYIPVRGNSNGSTIENLKGLDYTAIDDVEFLRDMMVTALQIPRQFLGLRDESGDKLALASQDIRFARTIERVQKLIVSELMKIAVIHLYAQGYTDDELTDFDLRLVSPSTIYEQEKLNLFKEKVGVAQEARNIKMLSEEWIYKEIFNFSDDEIEQQHINLVEDMKRQFRYTKLEAGESDPAKFGFPQEEPPPLLPPEGEEGDMTSEGQVGRPREGMSYGQDSHPKGRDPLGFRQQYDVIKHSGEREREDKPKSPLSTESKKMLKQIPRPKPTKVLSEQVQDPDLGTYLDENIVIKEEE